MTDEPPNPLALPHLKGAALPVLLLLWRFGPQNRPELVRRSGWSRHAVTSALEGLVDAGLVERLHYRAWRLAAPGRAALAPWLAVADPESPAAGFSVPGPGPAPDAEKPAGHRSAAAPGRPPPAESPPAGRSESGPRHPPQAERPPANLSETGPRRPAAAQEPPDNLSESCPRRPPQSEVPPAGLSAAPPRPPQAEEPPAGLSAAPQRPRPDHDHDDAYPDQHHQSDHIDRHHPDGRETGDRPPPGRLRDPKHMDEDRYDGPGPPDLAQRLRSLRPPFTRPEKWLAGVPAALVAAWLDYLDDRPAQERRAIGNESAFLRHQVSAGEWPPTRRRPACPVCGRAYFDSDGRCLVCAGVVQL